MQCRVTINAVNRIDLLGPYMSEQVVWHADTAPLRGELAQLLAGQWDINKLSQYLPVYESVLNPKRHQPVRLLEIGVSFGGSLQLWREYLGAGATIVGIDSNPRCAQLADPSRDIHVRIGQQQDHRFLADVVAELGPFDIIIDDGSHIPSFTLASFHYLFPNGLTDAGAYLVEDLHTCYSADCPPPELDDGTPQFTDVLKQLIDVMHTVYTQTPTGDEFSNSFEPDNPGHRREWLVPLATTLIGRIEIYDAIAVITRRPREVPRMIRRWSRDTMTRILNEDAARFLDEHPHLDRADRTRQDWVQCEKP